MLRMLGFWSAFAVAGGLKNGAPCPVFATRETWERLKRYVISDRRLILPYRPFHIGSTVFEAVPVEHSLRAPAVGLRVIQDQGNGIFYVPGVAPIAKLTPIQLPIPVPEAYLRFRTMPLVP